jgi:predicted GNAT superfamily acetyltransferase
LGIQEDFTMAPEQITVHKIQNTEHFYQCEEVQRRAWGMDNLSIVPAHVLIPAQQSGGLVLGAFNEKEKMVGFLFGFLGTRDPIPAGQTVAQRLKHCSHMMGVVPEYQSQGVGYLLKLAQAEHVRSQRLELVTWTYDPLESANANLNLCKLGVICNTYVPDYYGDLRDARNLGLPTDRFHVEWWVSSRRVVARLSGQDQRPTLSEVLDGGAHLVNQVHIDRKGIPHPTAHDLGATDAALLVEIPARFQSLKAADPALAMEWRLGTRELFTHYFEVGYTVSEFFSEITDDMRRSYYLLSKN